MVEQTPYERAKALKAQQAAPSGGVLTPYQKAKALAAQGAPAATAAPEVEAPPQDPAFMDADSVMALRPHRLTDVITSAPRYDNVEDALRAIRVGEAVEKIRKQGGVPYSVEAASSFVDASQAGFANQIDAIKAAKEGDRMKALGINLRTAVGSLPFVPAREPSQEAQDINEAINIVKAEQAKESFGHAAASTAGSLGGVVYGLNVAGAPVKAIAGGIQAARAANLAKTAGIPILEATKILEASKLAKAATTSLQFGAYESMPSLEALEPADAAKDFAKGTAVGAALEATGGLAGKIPVPPAWQNLFFKPVAQTGLLSGMQYAETGELPSNNEAIALALGLAIPGAAESLRGRGKTPKSTLRDPTIEEIGMAKDPIQAKPNDPMQQWAQAETGRARSEAEASRLAERRRKFEYLKANKTLKGFVPAEGETFLTAAGQKNRLSEVRDPATGSVMMRDRMAEPAPADATKPESPQFTERSVIETKPTFPQEPAFEAVLKGKRWIYLDPKDSVPTETELAFRKSPPSKDTLDRYGVSSVDTPIGKAYFNYESMQKFFAEPKNAQYADMAIRDAQGRIDPSGTISNFVKRDMVGALLGYGKGNESKVGAKFYVTGRDASGREVATIMAKNANSATTALREMGATQVEPPKPIEGIGDVIVGRKRAARRSRESGFFAPFPKAKTPNERRIEMEEEYKSDPKNVIFPQYDRIAKAAPEVYYHGVRAMSTPGAAVRRASDYTIKLWERLGNDPEKVGLFMRNLVEAQGVGLRAQGRTPGEHLFMTPEQRARYRANRDQFEGGYKTIDDIDEFLAEFNPDAGIKETSKRPIPEGERYFRIQSLHTPEARKAAYERAKRAGLDAGFVTDPSVMPPAEAPVSAMERVLGFSKFGARKAGSSKYASGQSPDVAIEPYTVIHGRIKDVVSPANHNRYRESIRKHAVEVPEGEIPKPVDFDGKMEPLVRIDLGQKPEWMKTADELVSGAEPAKSEPVYVPKPIADMYMDYVQKDPFRQPGLVSKMSDKAVGLSLAATGADAVVHLTAGVDMLSQIPGVGKTVAQRIAAQGGITRNLVSIREIADMTSPENQAILKKLELAGIIRQREAGPQAESGVERFSPFARLTDWMFRPGGKEDAIKVGLYNLINRYAPEMTEAQKLYTVGQIGGVYTRALQPMAVQKTPLALAPFIQMGTTKLRNAAMMIAGRRPESMVSGKGWAENTSAEIGWRYPSTVLSFLALSYLVGDDEKFEDVLQHPTTILVNGKEYPISRWLSPISDFAGRVTGLSELVKSKSLGYGPERTIQNVARSPVNAMLGYMGPIPSAVMGAFGMAPYLTQDGSSRSQFMPSGTVSQSPIKDALQRVAWRLIPYTDEATRIPEDPNASIGEKLFHAALATAGMSGKKPMDVESVQAKEGNAEWSKLNEVAGGIASEVARASEENRESLLKRLVADRFNSESREQGEARVRYIMMKMAKSRAAGLSKYQQAEDGK